MTDNRVIRSGSVERSEGDSEKGQYQYPDERTDERTDGEGRNYQPHHDASSTREERSNGEMSGLSFTTQLTPEQADEIKARWLANTSMPMWSLQVLPDPNYKPRHRRPWQRTRRWAWFVASMGPLLTWAHIVVPDAGLVAMGALGVCAGIVGIVEREVGR